MIVLKLTPGETRKYTVCAAAVFQKSHHIEFFPEGRQNKFDEVVVLVHSLGMTHLP